jgi:hypothetical protein
VQVELDPTSVTGYYCKNDVGRHSMTSCFSKGFVEAQLSRACVTQTQQWKVPLLGCTRELRLNEGSSSEHIITPEPTNSPIDLNCFHYIIHKAYERDKKEWFCYTTQWLL